ncbi:type II toxin-antitoxin system RelB/DinJ family antitoxin [Devosia sp.]|uniref:type II toxin-antitoxin system RelB/DinJ family antitoxin n=1 Tax=Devosia sp. TaxID=1871048 RepID=UPI0035ADC1BA
MAATAFVRARMDEKTRDAAAAVLQEMGLTVSDVIRMTLTRVARDGALPFELKIPNAETRAAMAEAEEIAANMRTRFSTPEEMFDALDKKSE